MHAYLNPCTTASHPITQALERKRRECYAASVSQPVSRIMASGPHNLDALRAQVIGQSVDTATLKRGDKGAKGRWVEGVLRNSQEGQRHPWAGTNESAPDMGDKDVKIITNIPTKNGWKPKEDMAISMISADTFGTSLDTSPMQPKMNLLVVHVVEERGQTTIVGLEHHDLRNHPQVVADFEQMGAVYQARQATMDPRWAIDGMGKASGAYGVALKSKTKGPGHRANHPRSRAVYINRAFVAQELMGPGLPSA